MTQEKKVFEGLLSYMGMVAILATWPEPFKQTFILPTHTVKALYEIRLQWTKQLYSRCLKVYIRVTLDKSQTMTLTSGIHMYSFTNLVDYIYINFQFTDFNSFDKI